jgi:hypothetical protein
MTWTMDRGETACDWQLLTIFDRILNWRSFD